MIGKIYLSFFRVKNCIYDVIDLVNIIKIYIHQLCAKMFIYIYFLLYLYSFFVKYVISVRNKCL